jgi:hypothetical protein
MVQAALKKKALFTRKFDLKLRKKVVKCYIGSIALHDAEIWTLQKVGQTCLEILEMWWWRRLEEVIWTDRVRNEEELHGVEEERNIL